MENRVLVEVRNDSEYTFVFDGEWLRSGEWKSDQSTQIEAKSLTVLELHSTNLVKGLACVLWWVDSEHVGVYLSIAVTNPRFGSPTFSAFAGPPPANLRDELDVAPRLTKDEQVAPEAAGGCAWVSPVLGNLTVVKLTIFPELPAYEPPKANPKVKKAPGQSPAEAQAGGSSSSSASPSSNGVTPAVPIDCTTLVATNSSKDGVPPPEDEHAAREAMGNFFNQTRPKDAVDGVFRGFKTAGTSVAAGMGTIVAASVSGYQTSGGMGLLKGFGTGILCGAGIAATGTVCGVAQIGRGIANTPDAFRSRREQRVWDHELGQWVDIDLCKLEEQVIEEGSDDESSDAAAGHTPLEKVADTEFYDLLKVQSLASGSEIKKAYYKEARLCHPDKNPGDAEAKVKFQQLADAYQVLSNPDSRKKYDKDGKAGIQEGNAKMDPSVFFSLLFGSEKFQPYIGELQLAMQTDQFAKSLEKGLEELNAEDQVNQGEVAAHSLKTKQHHREVHCACHLRDIMSMFVYSRDTQGFEERMRKEACELAQGQFGPDLLRSLGEMYGLRAELYLSDELVGRFSLTKHAVSMKHSAHTMGHRLNFYQNAAGSLLRVKKVHDAAKNAAPKEAVEGQEVDEAANELSAKAMEQALDEALPLFLQTAWAAVVTDIDGTIKEVGRKLLKDKSVPWQIRVRRAQALAILGRVFVEESAKAVAAKGTSESPMISSEAAKNILQEALMGSVREKK